MLPVPIVDDFEGGVPVVDEDAGAGVLGVRSGQRLSAQGHRSGSSLRSLDSTRRLAAAFRPWAGEGGAPSHSKPTEGDH